MFWSVWITKEKKTKWKVVVASVVFLILTFSFLILIRILLGAYPTFVPHILIGLVAGILIIQQIFISCINRKSNSRSRQPE